MQAPRDRIALVTGANGGIGFEIARQLSKEGIPTLIGVRDQHRGQTAVAGLRREGFAARYVQIDLTELATITGAAADIEAQEGRLDILINNAGITSSGDGSRQVQVSDCDNRSIATIGGDRFRLDIGAR
jgi:NAD(P)-dependent dehydrogenase (short-subunit alcohol dehydrogenase family)